MNTDQIAAEATWALMPRALHFNIMCGDEVIYEGVTSEKQGNALVNRHNSIIKSAIEKASQGHRRSFVTTPRQNKRTASALEEIFW